MVSAVIEREGGFVNDPSDRGSATRFGVTKATLSDWRKAPVTDEDVRNLSLSEARAILKDLYLVKPGIIHLGSDIIRAAMLDFAVHSGPTAAIRALQRVLGVSVDGVLGPVTLHAANLKTGQWLALKLNCQRLRLLGRIISKDPTQAKFAEGWCNRIAEQVESVV